LNSSFQLKSNPNVYFAGQVTGVEGYMESAASGLVVAIQIANRLNGLPSVDFTGKTILGALSKHVSSEFGNYSPMNSNFGILESLDKVVKDKSLKKKMYADRSIAVMSEVVKNIK
jgi:methylenetetrahydrofolate--tRNA-(uracil-5-)-methyltransferase